MKKTWFAKLLSRVPMALTDIYTLWVRTTYPFAAVGKNLSIHYACKLPTGAPHRLKLGNSVAICKDAWLNISAPSPANGEPIIILEDRCLIAPRCELSAKNKIHLERGVMLSPQVLIMDHNHAYEDPALPIRDQGVTEGGTIRIGEGCWIGHGAAIICNKGQLVLGRNCVVSANTVVQRSFPDYSVIAGSPARVVRQYDPQKGVWVLGSVRPSGSKQEPNLSTPELPALVSSD